ncbi:MAG: FeoB-associated Cys-rich membrane protein [Ruminococcaceae bacterium]|nr:FeoB-associated Cys-rich membrane protein [Oscillospiraceae bacterium]
MKETVIVAAIIVAVIGLAVFYIVRSKKQGRKCIGCPDSGNCPSAKNGGCSCGCGGTDQK